MARIKSKGTNMFVKIVFAAVIIYLLYVSADLCIKISEKKSQNSLLREQISIATIENEQLESTKNAEMDAEYVEKVAKELKQKSFVCDVADVKQVKKLKAFVSKTFDKIDCLINCAGMWTKGELSQLDMAHFAKINNLDRVKQLINTNIFGIIAMISEFSSVMIKQNFGQIININSQSGVEVEEFCPIYNASKHGSYAYRKAIQRDLAKHNNLQVCCMFDLRYMPQIKKVCGLL